MPPGQGERERRPRAHPALTRDVAPQQPCQMAPDRQPQPGAAVLRVLLLSIWRNSSNISSSAPARRCRFRCRLRRCASWSPPALRGTVIRPRLGELDRVAEQVDQDLGELLLSVRGSDSHRASTSFRSRSRLFTIGSTVRRHWRSRGWRSSTPVGRTSVRPGLDLGQVEDRH